MSNLLPIIEQLADAKSHGERARWLLACPVDILGRYDMTIRNRLMHGGFLPGIDYLNDLRVLLSGTRDTVTGVFTERTQASMAAIGGLMLDLAVRMDGGPGDASAVDHSLTDL